MLKIVIIPLALFFVQESFSCCLPEERLSNYLRFSVPFPLKSFTNVPPVFHFDFNKVRLITAPSIIKGVFKGNPERIKYFFALLKLENISMLQTEVSNLLDKSIFLKKNSNSFGQINISEDEDSYKKHVCQTLSVSLHNKKNRERVVSFLVALEYRKSITPAYTVVFWKSSTCFATNCKDSLFFDLEQERCRDLFTDKAMFTIPSLMEKSNVHHLCNGLTVAKSTRDDVYVFGHEFEHGTHHLLGIAPHMSFNEYIKNDFLRDTFFPSIGRTPLYMEHSLKALKAKADQAVREKKYPNENEYFRAKLDDMKKKYTQSVRLWDDKELKTSFDSFSKAIDTGSFGENRLEEAVSTQIKHDAFYKWTDPEELFQISGISFCSGYMFVNCLSDLDFFVANKRFFRWLYIVRDRESFRQEKNPFSFIDFSPSIQHIKGLLFLHGYDFDQYKLVANAHLFSTDCCWIYPYVSLTHVLKKTNEMNLAAAPRRQRPMRRAIQNSKESL